MVRDLGPAHTDRDAIVIVPSARTVFTGDLVFVRARRSPGRTDQQLDLGVRRDRRP